MAGALLPRSGSGRRTVALLVIALVSIALWQTYWGSLLLYPFTILATWFHEMGHGLTAMLTGGSFERLVIYSDGSGVAISTRVPGRFTDAAISAAGPLGPAVAGSLLVLASRSQRASTIALTVLAAAIIASLLIWVRSLAGGVVLAPFALALLVISRKSQEQFRSFTVQLLGVQAAISSYHQFDYVFSRGGEVDGQLMVSDTQRMADALFLPHWFWGGVITLMIAAMLFSALRFALRD